MLIIACKVRVLLIDLRTQCCFIHLLCATVARVDNLGSGANASKSDMSIIPHQICAHWFKIPIYTGGDTISVTSGVVSRIEVTSYVHGSTELLAVQIDAAINSGNSGALCVFAAPALLGVPAHHCVVAWSVHLH